MELAKKFLSTLFPSRCLVCHKTVVAQSDNENIEICSGCFLKLPHNKFFCCQCALPFPLEVSNTRLCGRCIKKPPMFDYVYSPFRYEEVVIQLVHQFKFNEKITFSRTFGEVMFNYWSSEITKNENRDWMHEPDCVLPVPLHKSRMRERGFNQSIELSRSVAKKLDCPIERKAITRKKSTVTQTGLNAQQRLKNIKGAFECVRKISYKHVLIIDDVITTGATVNELTRILKRNGVERVGVLSIARAPLKN